MNKLDNVKNILYNQDIPEKPVKVEKKEKGLYERSEKTLF